MTSRGGPPRRGRGKERRGRGNAGKPLSKQPAFVMLLADPEVRLLMRADKVDEGRLLRMLKGVSVRLRRAAAPKKRTRERKTTPSNQLRKYRRGVGIMLVNSHREIFIARRNDVRGEAWQMPQGGIDGGETPRAAAYRELREEIGTDNAEMIAESRDWLYYELPDEITNKAWGGRWKGQRQKWFLMLFKGRDGDIDVATQNPEFNAWRWASLDELESLAVSFKRKLYLSVIGQFAKTLNAKRDEATQRP